MTKQQVRQTGQQILDRMASGEKLRWVPLSMIAHLEYETDYRVLCIGNDFLDESEFDVGDLENNGEIASVEDEETGICDYFLAGAQR